MRKKVGIIKRNIAIFLIIAMSINSFGAIVSDNDGSAFITKSEFDALKSSFQSQIDTYNQSIDSKIDGAIASYLAGIKLATTQEEHNLYIDVLKDQVVDLSTLAFGDAGDTDLIFCLDSAEENRLAFDRGSESITMPHSASVNTKGWQWQGSAHWFVNKINFNNFSDFAFEATPSFIPIDELYHGKSTNENKVKLYEGIPIFRASADGHVSIDGCRGNSGVVFAIADTKFGKATPTGMKVNITGGSVIEHLTSGKYYYTMGTTSDFKIDFDVEKDKTYYFKCNGASSTLRSYVSFKIDGPIENQMKD